MEDLVSERFDGNKKNKSFNAKILRNYQKTHKMNLEKKIRDKIKKNLSISEKNKIRIRISENYILTRKKDIQKNKQLSEYEIIKNFDPSFNKKKTSPVKTPEKIINSNNLNNKKQLFKKDSIEEKYNYNELEKKNNLIPLDSKKSIKISDCELDKDKSLSLNISPLSNYNKEKEEEEEEEVEINSNKPEVFNQITNPEEKEHLKIIPEEENKNLKKSIESEIKLQRNLKKSLLFSSDEGNLSPLDFTIENNLKKENKEKVNTNRNKEEKAKITIDQSQNYNIMNLNKINNIVNKPIIVESIGFTINNLEKKDLNKSNLESVNTINLNFQKNPEKKIFEIYPLEKSQDPSSIAFSIIQNNNQNNINDQSLIISNPVNESINCTVSSKDHLSKRTIPGVYEIPNKLNLMYNRTIDDANEIKKSPEKSNNTFIENENKNKYYLTENLSNQKDDKYIIEKVKNYINENNLYDLRVTTEKSYDKHDPFFKNFKVLPGSRLNDTELQYYKNLDSDRLVLPANIRNNPTYRINNEPNFQNTIEDNDDLLSEKKKKDKEIDLLNQRFNEKLNNYKIGKKIENVDSDFDNFKNDFKKNNIFSDGKENEYNRKLEQLVISDERLNEFKDKYFGKVEIIDKEQVKLFYKKYLKGLNNKEKNQNPNATRLLEEKNESFVKSALEEKENLLKLEKLKNLLNIDDQRRSR